MTDQKKQTTRDGFGSALVEIARQNNTVVALTAD